MKNIILLPAIISCFLSVYSLSEEAEPQKNVFEALKEKIPVHGFIEYGYGSRITRDDTQNHDTLYNEARLRLDYNHAWDNVEVQFKGDAVYDGFQGEALFDWRETYALVLPADWTEAKLGRQILTWGTGDYLFINDMFPKDWISFFIGRDDEYLKAPSNSVKLSFFPDIFDINMVWTPKFTPDEYVTGQRLSYYNPLTQELSGSRNQIYAEDPKGDIENGEFALRIYKNIKGYEFAGYAYKGFFKRPEGFNTRLWKNYFPKLAVYGGSVRGNVFGGIGNAEFGYYDSIEDRKGDNPLIENSSARGLLGYTREIVKDFSAGIQWYFEYMKNYDEYDETYLNEPAQKDRFRQLLTLRLTRYAMMQNLIVSLFTFYSPTDNDAYLRPSVTYKYNDHLSFSVGGNIFLKKYDHTFFGQLEDNTNIYIRARYSF